MFLFVLCILVIIASWILPIPLAWSIVLTIFAAVGFLEIAYYVRHK